MTRVSYIHATPEKVPKNEWAQRAAEYTGQLLVPFNELTEGETLLWMAYNRLRMFADYYRESRTEYLQAAAIVQDILANGLHTGADALAYNLPSGLRDWLGNLVQASKNQVRPAMGRFSTRPHVGAKIGNIIPLPDCFDTKLNFQDKLKCAQDYEWVVALNEQVVKTSHHFLYNWRKPEHTAGLKPESAAVIAAKGVLHATGVTAVANISEFNRDVMQNYMETGMMERNLKAGIPPLNGSQGIFQLREGSGIDIAEYAPPGSGIGAFAAIIPFIKVIVEAIVAIAGLVGIIASLKKVDIKTGQLRALGSLEFSPNGTDFDTTNQADTGLNNNTLLLLALGGGLLYFGTQNEKK